eukprot:TRINITY_DN2096_c0_g1_i1.p2 TRINITY_DN2096_c0_g1~~TRINITY_DN2096_c0_g1_i1.p2  ORF type:complete len:66 (-),score=0.57 TRINITY_DN2096_c0_g1_i1:39-236(-)
MCFISRFVVGRVLSESILALPLLVTRLLCASDKDLVLALHNLASLAQLLDGALDLHLRFFAKLRF